MAAQQDDPQMAPHFFILQLCHFTVSAAERKRAEGHQNDASRETRPLLTRLARCIIAYHHSRLISTRRGVHAHMHTAAGGYRFFWKAKVL